MTDPRTGVPLEIITNQGVPLYYNPYSQQYTRSKSYAQRMQRNYARGLPQQQARGKRQAEHVTRAQQEQQRYGDELTPEQRFQFGFERRYGFTYRYWRKLYRNYIQEINQRALPNPHSNYMMIDANGRRADPRVFPSDVAAIKQLYDTGYRDPLYPDIRTWEDWIEYRLYERLDGIREFQDFHNVGPGRTEFQNRSSIWLNINLFGGSVGPPIELWYYH